MELPTISSYGNYSSDNYGAHCLTVEVGPVQVWYSYKTPVAFRVGPVFVIRQNDWGPTTGKHLKLTDGGSIDARKERVDGERFEMLWNEHVAPLFDGVMV